MRHEYDHVIKDAHGFRVGTAGELPGGFDELVSAYYFIGVQAAIYPYYRLSFVGEGLGLRYS